MHASTYIYKYLRVLQLQKEQNVHGSVLSHSIIQRCSFYSRYEETGASGSSLFCSIIIKRHGIKAWTGRNLYSFGSWSLWSARLLGVTELLMQDSWRWGNFPLPHGPNLVSAVALRLSPLSCPSRTCKRSVVWLQRTQWKKTRIGGGDEVTVKFYRSWGYLERCKRQGLKYNGKF